MLSKTKEHRAAYWAKWYAKNKPEPKPCQKCGELFEPKGSHKRCEPCRVLTCGFCNKPFLSPQGNFKQKFCSQKCQSSRPEVIERLKQNRGTKPRTYFLRHRDKRGCAEDRDWRKAIFERDNYTCQHCNQRGGKLQADHIKPFKEFPELRHELSNGRTLCIECHKKTPTYGWSKYWHKKIAAKRLSQEVLDFTGIK